MKERKRKNKGKGRTRAKEKLKVYISTKEWFMTSRIDSSLVHSRLPFCFAR